MTDSQPPFGPRPTPSNQVSADLRRQARLARHPEAGRASDPAGPYAGWRRRSLAALIDVALACVFVAACFGPVYWVAERSSGAHRCRATPSVFVETDRACGEAGLEALAVFVLLGSVAVIPLLIGVALYGTRLGRTGTSIGRRWLGIRLVDAATGLPIGGWRTLARWLIAVNLSLQLAMIGYLWMLWDDREQTWHDRLVRSVVVRDARVRPRKQEGVGDGGADDGGRR